MQQREGERRAPDGVPPFALAAGAPDPSAPEYDRAPQCAHDGPFVHRRCVFHGVEMLQHKADALAGGEVDLGDGIVPVQREGHRSR